MTPGPRNLITDVAGLRVGHASDAGIKTGATVLLGDVPFVAGVHVMGGAPGTRETDLLAPDKLVQEVDALVLSGGSAFGLDAASGVADGLRAMGRGYPVPGGPVPIVPGAILFDLANGGDKGWTENPYKNLGLRALQTAQADFAIGSVGAGTGATTANLKGGLGSASAIIDGITVGALVAVNPLGQVTVDRSAHFWAAPFELGDEFGGLGPAPRFDPHYIPAPKLHPEGNTTIAIIATDALLTRPRRPVWPSPPMMVWPARSCPAIARLTVIWSLQRPPGPAPHRTCLPKPVWAMPQPPVWPAPLRARSMPQPPRPVIPAPVGQHFRPTRPDTFRLEDQPIRQ